MAKVQLLRSDDPNPEVRKRRREIEQEVRRQMGRKVKAAQEAENIRPEDLNAIVR